MEEATQQQLDVPDSKRRRLDGTTVSGSSAANTDAAPAAAVATLQAGATTATVAAEATAAEPSYAQVD
jgi:hypothetical protein